LVCDRETCGSDSPNLQSLPVVDMQDSSEWLFVGAIVSEQRGLVAGSQATIYSKSEVKFQIEVNALSTVH
jgi:hypothetical protein